MRNLPRLNEEERENINRAITSTRIETVIKNPPTNKSPRPDSFTGEFFQTFKEKLMFILLKLFAKKVMPPNSFYKASLTLVPKPEKDITKKEITGKYH